MGIVLELCLLVCVDRAHDVVREGAGIVGRGTLHGDAANRPTAVWRALPDDWLFPAKRRSQASRVGADDGGDGGTRTFLCLSLRFHVLS